MKYDMCIIIPGHDSYSDIVKLYTENFYRYWKDCKYPLIWSNGISDIDDKRVIVINNGSNSSFCKRIKNAALNTDAEYILLTMEDFIISKNVDTNNINKLLNIMRLNNYNYCKLLPVAKSKRKKFDVLSLCETKEDLPYGLSINCGIFRKDFLLDLIKDENWNGWEFENYCLKLASERKLHNCVHVSSNVLNIVHLIAKGKIIPKSKKSLENKGINLNGIRRETLSRKEMIKMEFLSIFGRRCPIFLRKKIKKIINILGISTVTKY